MQTNLINNILLFFVLLISALNARAFSEVDIARSIKSVAIKYGVDEKILMGLAGTESDYEPLAITVETSGKKAYILSQLKDAGIKTIYSPTRKTFHSKHTVISFYPDNLDLAQDIVVMLKDAGFTFDVGLMQINSVNFKKNEAHNMLLPEQNIEKAGKVYSHCKKLFRSLKHQVECYNRGGGNLRRALLKNKKYNYFPYWERFVRHYRGLYHSYPQ